MPVDIQHYTCDQATGAPPPVGPFSHATRFGQTLYVTGQMPTDPATGLLIDGDVVEQTRQVLRNLDAIVTQCGGRLRNAVMVRIYLRDFADYDAVNTEYGAWFSEPRPSRTCVGTTGLAVGALVEIDLIVALEGA